MCGMIEGVRIRRCLKLRRCFNRESECVLRNMKHYGVAYLTDLIKKYSITLLMHNTKCLKNIKKRRKHLRNQLLSETLKFMYLKGL